MAIVVIDPATEFSGARNITPDPDSKRELGDLIAELQTQSNANETMAGAHAARHITGGGDTIASAVSGGAAGLMTGADKAAHDTVVADAIRDGDFAGIWNGLLTRNGVGTYRAVKSGGGAVGPTVNDDDTQDYAVGSLWIDAVRKRFYVCMDNTTGAAVWAGPLKLDHIGNTAPTVNDDNTLGYWEGSTWLEWGAGKTVYHICVNASTGAAVWNPIVKHRIDATTAPGANDDHGHGYQPGSTWTDTTNDHAYICVDASAGAAVWRIVPDAAGGELAGTYPNPTIADGVVDAANARPGSLAGLVVDKGVPSTVVVAFDDGGGNADRPADGATYSFSIDGGLVATMTAADAPATENDFQRHSAGVEEDDTILMAAAFAAAINAHSVLGLVVHAEVYGGAGDGRWYIECRTTAQADITAGLALTCVLGGADPGEVITRATAVTASKRQLFPIRYAVTAQDVLAGEIRFGFGCAAIVAYQLDILTAAADYTRIAWDGAVDTTGGRLTLDNSGGTDWATGNVITGWILGTVA